VVGNSTLPTPIEFASALSMPFKNKRPGQLIEPLGPKHLSGRWSPSNAPWWRLSPRRIQGPSSHADPRIADDNVVEAILLGIVDGECGGIPANGRHGVGAPKTPLFSRSRPLDRLSQFVNGTEFDSEPTFAALTLDRLASLVDYA
jgi:hypothetical protein